MRLGETWEVANDVLDGIINSENNVDLITKKPSSDGYLAKCWYGSDAVVGYGWTLEEWLLPCGMRVIAFQLLWWMKAFWKIKELVSVMSRKK